MASQPGSSIRGAESRSIRTENPLDALLDELQTFAKPPSENDAPNTIVDITTIITPASPAPTSVVPTNILSNPTTNKVSPLSQTNTMTTPVSPAPTSTVSTNLLSNSTPPNKVSPLCINTTPTTSRAPLCHTTTMITPASPAPTSVVPTNVLSNTTTNTVSPLCLNLPSGMKRLPSYPSSDSQPSPVKTPTIPYPGVRRNSKDNSLKESRKAANTPTILHSSSSETPMNCVKNKSDNSGVRKSSITNYENKPIIETNLVNHSSETSKNRNEMQVNNKSEQANCSSKRSCEDLILPPKEKKYIPPKLNINSNKDSVSNRISKGHPLPPCPPARSSSKASTILPLSACGNPGLGKLITPGGLVTSDVNGVLRNSEGRELYGPVLRQRPPLGRASFSEDSSFSSASTNSSTGSSRAGQLSSNSSSTESVNSQEGASSKSQHSEPKGDSKKRNIDPNPRPDVLEQRHIELLRRQKQLQEQYQRLQNIQRSGGRLAPANVDLKKTGSESNLTAQLGLSLHPSSLGGSHSTTAHNHTSSQPPTHISTLPKNFTPVTTNELKYIPPDKCRPTLDNKENSTIQGKLIRDIINKETDII